MGRLNWGGLLIGALAGLGAAAFVSIVLFAAGLRLGESPATDTVFAVVQISALVVAGYVGGRFAHGDAATRALHGAIAALFLFAVAAAIAASAGSDLTPLAIGGGGLVALVLGSAGGVLAAS